jgi:3-keto-disaccharide hydrolase
MTSLCLMGVLAATADAADPSPYLGRWALTIPGGGAGWLGVTQEDKYLDASILWGGGSVVPVASVYLDDDALIVTRTREVQRKNEAGDIVRKHTITETITARVDGDGMNLTISRPHEHGRGVWSADFTGKRIPDLPAKPDLSKVKYGEPITLLNEDNLDGWTLTSEKRVNGWRVENGELINNPAQPEDGGHISYGNLRTVQEFEDFNLKLEVNVPENGNSGIYLRGIYEVQVLDSFGKDRNPHHMGSIYSRYTPLVTAEKPHGEWQTMDITLVDRHLTVLLNGQVIHDNLGLEGCTGGALTSDEFVPGPIYLQGDHTGVQYRNLVLTPVIK